MKGPAPLNRRDFLMMTGCLAGLGAAFQTLEGCSSDDDPASAKVPANFTIDLDDPANAALQNIGGAVIKAGVIIIRQSSTGYVALSRTCTHASCTVNYNGSTGRLVCPCHGSVFSNTGQVIQGPASSPLPGYNVSVMGNILTITS